MPPTLANVDEQQAVQQQQQRLLGRLSPASQESFSATAVAGIDDAADESAVAAAGPPGGRLLLPPPPEGADTVVAQQAHSIAALSCIQCTPPMHTHFRARLLAWFQLTYGAFVARMRACPLGGGPDGSGNPYHAENNLWAHTLLALYALPPDASLNAVVATLFHDCGKVYTADRAAWRYGNAPAHWDAAQTGAAAAAAETTTTTVSFDPFYGRTERFPVPTDLAEQQATTGCRIVRRNSGKYHERVGAVLAAVFVDTLRAAAFMRPLEHLLSKATVVKLVAHHMDIDLARCTRPLAEWAVRARLHALWHRYALEQDRYVRDMIALNRADSAGRFNADETATDAEILAVVHSGLLDPALYRLRTELTRKRHGKLQRRLAAATADASSVVGGGQPLPPPPPPRIVLVTALSYRELLAWRRRHCPAYVVIGPPAREPGEKSGGGGPADRPTLASSPPLVPGAAGWPPPPRTPSGFGGGGGGGSYYVPPAARRAAVAAAAASDVTGGSETPLLPPPPAAEQLRRTLEERKCAVLDVTALDAKGLLAPCLDIIAQYNRCCENTAATAAADADADPSLLAYWVESAILLPSSAADVVGLVFLPTTTTTTLQQVYDWDVITNAAFHFVVPGAELVDDLTIS